MLRAATYARKSTEQNGVAQDAKSVTRQVEESRLYAQRKGWTHLQEHTYSDDGISGAEFDNRPGFVRLMNALRPRADFDVLIVADLSRLGREQLETGYALKQLSQAGVRVFSYLEDREVVFDTPTEKFLMSAMNFAAEVERDKAGQRTTDVLAQKARAGHVTGGRVFGYDNVAVEVPGPDGTPHRSHVEHRINPQEAEVVRRMFLLYANQGFGYTRIAKFLNDERALAPRPQQGRPSGWAPSSVREVLLRDRYRGLVVWNRTKKRDRWGTAKRTPRPREEWVEVRVEDLRIVPEELWEAVERQRGMMERRSLRSAGGKLLGRPPGSGAKHLLAGVAVCVCGASIEARTRQQGRRRVLFYGCSAYHRKGKHVCANGLTMRADVLEEAILGTVEKVVLDPSVVQAALDEAVDRIIGDCGEKKQAELREECQRLDEELARLGQAVANGGESTTLVAEVHKREARRAEIEAAMKMRSHQNFSKWRSKTSVRKDLEGRIHDWRGLLRRRAAQGQQILRKLIDGRLLLTPHADKTPAYYEFEGTGTLTGLLAGIVPHKLASPTGFEPVS